MRKLAIIVPVVLLVALSGAPAHAAGGFTKPHRVTPTGCYDSHTSLDSSGAQHGFILCRNKQGYTSLDYVQATAGASKWSLSKVNTNTYALLGAADDGSTSYALITQNNKVYLVKRSRSGSHSTTKLSSMDAPNGAIVARGSKWFAVWDEYTSGDGSCPYLYYAGNLGGGSTKAHELKDCTWQPSLAITASGSPTAVYEVGNLQAGSTIDELSWRSGHPSQPKAVTKSGRSPALQISGKTMRVAYGSYVKGSYAVTLASRKGKGKWRTKSFPQVLGNDETVGSRPEVTSGGGNVFVAWTTVDKQNKERVEVQENSHGKWSGSELTDGTKSGDAVFSDIAVHGGRAYVVMAHSDTTIYTLTTHQ